MKSSKMALCIAGLLTAAAGTWLMEGFYYFLTRYSYSTIADGQADFRIPYFFAYLTLLSWTVFFRWLVSWPRIVLASLAAVLGSLAPVTFIVMTAYAHSPLPLPQIWERVRGAYGALLMAQLTGLVLLHLLFWAVKKRTSSPLVEHPAP